MDRILLLPFCSLHLLSSKRTCNFSPSSSHFLKCIPASVVTLLRLQRNSRDLLLIYEWVVEIKRERDENVPSQPWRQQSQQER